MAFFFFSRGRSGVVAAISQARVPILFRAVKIRKSLAFALKKQFHTSVVSSIDLVSTVDIQFFRLIVVRIRF